MGRWRERLRGSMKTSYYPRARRAGLQVQELDDETLVFDSTNDQANCLNATATLVWKYADGTRSVPDLANELTRALGTPVDQRVMWYALGQLSNKNLLQESAVIPNEYGNLTRRGFLTKAGLVGTAVAIPVIVSIVAPSPAHAQSGCVGFGGPCTSDGQCCSGFPSLQCCEGQGLCLGTCSV